MFRDENLKFVFLFLLFASFTFSEENETISLILVGISFYLIIVRSGEVIIPIREIILLSLVIQLLFMPYLFYNLLDMPIWHAMEVDQVVYFNYVTPAFICFSLGLYFLKFPAVSSVNIDDYNDVARRLILIGFLAHPFGHLLPSQLAYFFTLLSYFKYIGGLIFLYSNYKNRYLWAMVAFTPMILSNILTGMFYDFLTWSLFILVILMSKFRIKIFYKLSFFVVAVLSVLVIQNAKSYYRSKTWTVITTQNLSKLEIFRESLIKSIENLDFEVEEEESEQYIRFNQGYILSRIMNHTPLYEPFANGQTIRDGLYGAIVPRFIDPDKPIVGGGSGLYSKFTGYVLHGSTSKDIGIFGEAYANFGLSGALILLLMTGLLIGFIIQRMFIWGKDEPFFVFWIPFLLFYTIRAEESYTPVLNNIAKSAFVLWFFYSFYFKKIIKAEKKKLKLSDS